MASKISNDELLARIKTGDESALVQFVEQNKPLVVSIVKRFSRSGIDEDLLSIGMVGLMKAIHHFNADYPVRFSTYAVPIIMGEIKRFFRDDGNMRISRSLKEGYVAMTKVKEELIQQHGRAVSYQEIADAMHLEVGDVILAFEANQFVYSLDEPVYEKDGSTIHLSDRVSSAERDVALHVALCDEIKRLSEKEQQLLYYRYTLSMKQEDTAKRLQISQVQVSRLEKKIIEKLRMALLEQA